ncbi:sulfur carrier protein ThiS [Ichthyobacterium seriolicida]|uniref:Thiamine biosynthesis protein n=1 Tax=Ichthyobacterium seriolicida TaxID=242600 RepID=A0A1J1EAL8_9FLAO|nr:sulfur carrier protein ThiS [Ichthyobacterium seriolicida]BAV94560.1 thiamine biosynthesis protein [Ichthyobacterium seriolicida]
MINITVNGKPMSVSPDTTVSDLLSEMGVEECGTAVAFSNEILSSALWSKQTFKDNDKMIVIRAIQGG